MTYAALSYHSDKIIYSFAYRHDLERALRSHETRLYGRIKTTEPADKLCVIVVIGHNS